MTNTEPTQRELQLAASVKLTADSNWTEAIAKLLAQYRGQLELEFKQLGYL